MALLMVMTVCLLVYAALEYRIRKALKDQGGNVYFVRIMHNCHAWSWAVRWLRAVMRASAWKLAS